MIVVDTNVVAYAVIPGDKTEAALAVAQQEPDWVAPHLWRSELRNVLATALRVGRIDVDSALAAFAAAVELVEDVDVESSTQACLEIAERGGISGYDAEFILVAEQMGLKLVTADRRLARAFPERTIDLEEFAGLT